MQYPHCTSDLFLWLLTYLSSPFSFALLRTMERSRRSTSPMWLRRARRRLMPLSLNCSKSWDRDPLARWHTYSSLLLSMPVIALLLFLLCTLLFVSRVFLRSLQVFLVRKVTPPDANQLYAMKVLKKATLKGTVACDVHECSRSDTDILILGSRWNDRCPFILHWLCLTTSLTVKQF